MRSKYIGLLAAACMAIAMGSLSGCATLFPSDSQLAQQVAVQYATGKFIESKPAAERAARAAQVKSVAEQVKVVAASDSATVAAIHELAMAKVNGSHLSASDRLLATALVEAVVQELSGKVVDGVLKPDDRVVVMHILDWVITAAVAYGAPA